jgi:hypothetical protein
LERSNEEGDADHQHAPVIPPEWPLAERDQVLKVDRSRLAVN